MFTGEKARQQRGQQRSLIFRMDVREHAEQETVAGHGVQNPRQREHRADKTVKRDVKRLEHDCDERRAPRAYLVNNAKTAPEETIHFTVIQPRLV